MLRPITAAAAVMLLAASTAAAQTAPPRIEAAPIATDEDPAPVPPAGAPAGFVTPAQDEGGYVTPNRGLGGGEAVWHLRVALNVAALGCHGGGVDHAAAYNALLGAARLPLAAASTATEAAYRQRYADAWQAKFDGDMTRLYNFFAQPPAHDGFCAAAATLLREAAAVDPAAFASFAAAALPRVEAPFTRFFAAYDGYRAMLAAWRSRHAAIAPVAAAPVTIAAVTIAAVDTTRLRGPLP